MGLTLILETDDVSILAADVNKHNFVEEGEDEPSPIECVTD